jgi:hypothetical protein
MDVEAMRRHVAQVCSRHDLVVRWVSRPLKAHSFRKLEEIWIVPIRSSLSYATALHEIGHVLGSHQGSKSVVIRERWAWEWARKNAIIWTDAMERHARECIRWYREPGHAVVYDLWG